MKNHVHHSQKLSKKVQDSIRNEVTIAHDLYERGLTKRALYKTNDIEISHDLIQTTFLKTLRYLQRGGKIATMRSFLNHVLNDLIIDEYRKHKVASLDVLLENGYEPSEDEQERMIDELDGKKTLELLTQLPEKYQSVLRMRYLQSLSLKEISQLTGQSQNTIAVQAHRGLVKLRSLYTESSK